MKRTPLPRSIALSRSTVLLVTASLACMFAASAAYAECDPSRWTNPNDPHNQGQFPAIPGTENLYVNLNSGQINADGNIEFDTVALENEAGVCTIETWWEVNCDSQQYRNLMSKAFHDKDWPTDQDLTVQGDKVWISYNTPQGVMRIGYVANQFCARRYQLPRKAP
jgi:hypothetical protein